jgi:ABC-type uncharacterized transport system permease subunit
MTVSSAVSRRPKTVIFGAVVAYAGALVVTFGVVSLRRDVFIVGAAVLLLALLALREVTR